MNLNTIIVCIRKKLMGTNFIGKFISDYSILSTEKLLLNPLMSYANYIRNEIVEELHLTMPCTIIFF